MAALNQLTGGAFQDSLGVVLASGYLLLELSQDAQVNTSTQVVSGYIVRISLDANGNVATSPAQLVWPNDVLSPAGTFYNVSVYNAQGQLVWGPNAQQVLSSPSPFNIGTWVPGSVSTLPPTAIIVSGVTLASSATAGAQTLPANPVAFLPVNINGTNYKLALYST